MPFGLDVAVRNSLLRLLSAVLMMLIILFCVVCSIYFAHHIYGDENSPDREILIPVTLVALTCIFLLNSNLHFTISASHLYTHGVKLYRSFETRRYASLSAPARKEIVRQAEKYVAASVDHSKKLMELFSTTIPRKPSSGGA